MKNGKILLSLFLFLSISLYSQTSRLDSLQNELKNAVEDTSKVNLLIKIGSMQLNNFSLDEAEATSKKASSLAEKIDYQLGIARSIQLEGLLLDSKSDFDGALDKFNKALEIYTQLNSTKDLASIELGIANSYYSKGKNDKALEGYMSSIKYREPMNDSNGIASSYMGLSNVYSQMNRPDLALFYAKKALYLKEKYHDEKLVSWLLNNIGAIYLQRGDTTSTLEYYFKSIDIKTKLNDDDGLATTYKNVGSIFMKRRNFLKALEYYHKAFDIRSRINPNDAYELSNCYDDIGVTYTAMGKFDSAFYFVKKAVDLSEKAHSYEAVKLPYLNMAIALYKLGRYQEGYDYLLKHLEAKDSTLNTQTNALMTEMAAKYDNEKKEQQLALQQSEISNQKKSKNFLLGLVALVVILAFVMFRSYINKKKANDLLAEKNDLIEMQKQVVESKNKDITDSIHYAKRIQQAILPSLDVQKNILPEAFILYKPKDIVSGDFYWMEQWGKETIVAAIDCTGHGVPGAFMSFVAYSLLNEAVIEHGITQPSIILNEMRKSLNKMLRQKNEEAVLKDGMDISVCTFNFEANTLYYAGANNSMWLIRNNTLIEYKADKQPVGAFMDSQFLKPFTNNKINLQKGDTIYIFTDGYADQFGGSKGKKFKYKQLQELLLSIHQKSMVEQERFLNTTIEDWKGSLEQVDDILIIGIRM